MLKKTGRGGEGREEKKSVGGEKKSRKKNPGERSKVKPLLDRSGRRAGQQYP